MPSTCTVAINTIYIMHRFLLETASSIGKDIGLLCGDHDLCQQIAQLSLASGVDADLQVILQRPVDRTAIHSHHNLAGTSITVICIDEC